MSLISAIPAIGLIGGGLKIKKGVKVGKVAKKKLSQEVEYVIPKGVPIEEGLKTQKGMYEKAQNVVKKFGEDPLDTDLVGGVVDEITLASKSLIKSGKRMDTLLAKGMDYDEALAVLTFYESKSKSAIQASKNLAKMGTSELEIWGKEAVDEMARLIKKGRNLAMEDALTGKYNFTKVFK
jgi:hypothetical protein